MPRAPRTALVLVALGAGALASASTSEHSARGASAPPIGFATPTLADPVHTYGEPDMGVDNTGRVFASGPTGTGTQRSAWSASVDGGQTYRLVNQCALPSQLQQPCTPPNAPNPFAGTNAVPGGGDTEIVFDNHTGAGQPGMYFSDLYALTCFRVEASHDGGATTFNQAYPGGCAGIPPTADRQWQAVYDPVGVTSTSLYNGSRPLIYLVYNGGGARWTKSTDGVNYTVADGGSAQFGNDGYPAIDQVTGKVFEAADNGSGCLTMNIGTPDAAGNLTFLAAANMPNIACGLLGSPDVHWAVLSMDSARNLIAEWTIGSSTFANDQVFIAGTPAHGAGDPVGVDQWDTWTPAVQVSDGLVSTGDAVNSFSWGVAGGPGRADVAWYGGDGTGDPNLISGQTWNLFMSQAVFPTNGSGAITAKAVVTPPIKAAPHPMHYNDICGAGTGCILQQGNRNLADFFKVTIDSTGAAEIVYDDTSNDVCQQAPPFVPPAPGPNQQTVDHCGAPVVTVIRQNSGPGLFGTNVSDGDGFGHVDTPSPPRDHIGGASYGNKSLFPVIGGSYVPGMDLLYSGLSLSGTTLTVTMQVADLRAASTPTTLTAIPGAANLEYVTRWVMATPKDATHQDCPVTCYEVFYAGMVGNDTVQSFYAGPGQSSDLCSVSACFPHVQLYPESASAAPGTPVNGFGESGTATCPATPSVATPCTITISVNTAHIGNPTSSSLLEEVGAYSFAVSHFQAGQTQSQSQADNVQLQIGGVCCFNFKANSTGGTVPEFPIPAALLLATGLVIVVAGRRAHSRRRMA